MEPKVIISGMPVPAKTVCPMETTLERSKDSREEQLKNALFPMVATLPSVREESSVQPSNADISMEVALGRDIVVSEVHPMNALL